ncbi:hypothetical protein BBP40_004850 [Aspergillus hancockii]|nr:hypothetical protein BBP40_004850 [Aspergillus hancockii]
MKVSRFVRSLQDDCIKALVPDRITFITGAAGFLSSEILQQLCARTDVARVIVHIRASTAEYALARCKKPTVTAQW